jgi:hypothetical protein
MFYVISNKTLAVVIKATEGLSDKAFDTGWRIAVCKPSIDECKNEAKKLGLIIIDNEELRDILFQDNESMDFYVRVVRNKPIIPIY